MTSSVRRSPGTIFAFVLGGVLLIASLALAEPLIHELFEPDPAEDLLLGATTQSGALPAAIMTPSGPVGAPPERGATGSIYGGSGSSQRGGTYHLDPFTAPPTHVSYDDPFRPATVPYKRAFAFDHVADDLSLRVQNEELERVRAGGAAGADEDVFFAALDVDLVASEPVRIVSVAAGARVLGMRSEPERELEVLRDSAENWFLFSPGGGRVRVVMEVSAPRRAFGSLGPLGNWQRLRAKEEPSEAVRAAAEPVLRAISVSAELAPSQALDRLVGYFRSFTASFEPPKATGARDLYRELSLMRRGVCRHRAYAFVVTATALGFSVRLVQNEAHAWVEVFDGDGFVRIDLGGAALELEARSLDPSLPLHQPPRDPFFWPPGQMGGLDLGRSVSRSSSPVRSGWPSAAGTDASARITPPSGDAGGEALITLTLDRRQAQRGQPLGVSGSARLGDAPCGFARVDLEWVVEGGESSPLGSVATDKGGRFAGQVPLPRGARVGDGVVRARLAGACVSQP